MLEELLSVKIKTSTTNRELKEYQLEWNSEHFKYLNESAGKKLLSDNEKTVEIAKRFITRSKV